jgi:hypothetical protein
LKQFMQLSVILYIHLLQFPILPIRDGNTKKINPTIDAGNKKTQLE